MLPAVQGDAGSIRIIPLEVKALGGGVLSMLSMNNSKGIFFRKPIL